MLCGRKVISPACDHSLGACRWYSRTSYSAGGIIARASSRAAQAAHRTRGSCRAQAGAEASGTAAIGQLASGTAAARPVVDGRPPAGGSPRCQRRAVNATSPATAALTARINGALRGVPISASRPAPKVVHDCKVNPAKVATTACSQGESRMGRGGQALTSQRPEHQATPQATAAAHRTIARSPSPASVARPANQLPIV